MKLYLDGTGSLEADLKYGEPKHPVRLSLTKEDGSRQFIGMVRLIHTAGNPEWSQLPYERSARTVEEVVQAILDRKALFDKSLAAGLFVSASGTIFDLSGGQGRVTIEEGILVVDGKKVTFGGRLFPISALDSEGVFQISFTGRKDHLQISDGLESRPGKGLFVDPATGRLYRA